MRVAKTIPYLSEIAMGIMNLACLDVSNIIGAGPPEVGIGVRRMDRSREEATVGGDEAFGRVVQS